MLLINPNSQEISAKIIKNGSQKKLIVQDQRINAILENCGITVPKGFHSDKSRYIYPSNPDENLFAEAFEKHFFPHGLAQRGFYWIEEEKFSEKRDECSILSKDEIIKRHILSIYK